MVGKSKESGRSDLQTTQFFCVCPLNTWMKPNLFSMFSPLNEICQGWRRKGPWHHCEECKWKQGRCHRKIHQGLCKNDYMKTVPFHISLALESKTNPRCALNVTTTFATGDASNFSRIISLANLVEIHQRLIAHSIGAFRDPIPSIHF